MTNALASPLAGGGAPCKDFLLFLKIVTFRPLYLKYVTFLTLARYFSMKQAQKWLFFNTFSKKSLHFGSAPLFRRFLNNLFFFLSYLDVF